MARFDAIGMWWQDEVKDGRANVIRVQPPIPDTGWQRPREFPNLSAAKCIAIDTETWDPELTDFKDEEGEETISGKGPGWARGKGHIVGISVATEDMHRWYFPMRHEVEPEWNLDPSHVLAWASDTLGHRGQPKVFANAMYDIGWLAHEGVRVEGEIVDVQFAEALLNEAAKVDLETLSQKYLNTGKETDTLYRWLSDYYGGPIGPKQRRNIYRAPPRMVGPYAETDAINPILIAWEQYPLLVREGMLDLFRMECELVRLLIKMRFAGVSVNLAKAEQLGEELRKRAKVYKIQLKEVVGFDVDVNSSVSLAKAFDHLGLQYPYTDPTPKKPNGSPSFVKLFLESVDHPVGALITNIRKCEKLDGTFVQSYILDSAVNGKVYGQYHPLRGEGNGTRSGRYSSSTPNLTNLPSRDEELAPLVRGIFEPDYGHKQWRRYDYSQIEYRFLAHFARGTGSEELRELYRRHPDTDFHKATRERIAAKSGKDIGRKPAKNINFGLVFGMGEPKLIRSLGLTQQQGRALFQDYHTSLPYIRETMQWCSQEALSTGTITTILGRKSRFDLWEPNQRYGKRGVKFVRKPALPLKEALEAYGSDIKRAYGHKALNRKLQGSAADLLKQAMFIAWQSGIFDYIGVPRLLVHDETDFSDEGGNEDAWAEFHRILITAIPLSLPVMAECDVGPDWGACT